MMNFRQGNLVSAILRGDYSPMNQALEFHINLDDQMCQIHHLRVGEKSLDLISQAITA
jgi:hypothetical protein